MRKRKTVATPSQAGETPAGEEKQETANAERAKLHRKHIRALRSLLIRLAALCLVLYVLLFHLVGIMVMPSADMYPRIDAGDLVLFYRLEKKYHAQDVIVFEKATEGLNEAYDDLAAYSGEQAPEKPWWRKALDFLGFRDPAEHEKTRFVCRIVAGPGDTVQISEGERLMVNGNTMIENNIFYATPMYGDFVTYPLQLGEGQYFVLADSRGGGADSRFFGPVEAEDILGTVITILRRNNL